MSGLHVCVFGLASGSTPRRKLSLMHRAVGPLYSQGKLACMVVALL